MLERQWGARKLSLKQSLLGQYLGQRNSLLIQTHQLQDLLFPRSPGQAVLNGAHIPYSYKRFHNLDRLCRDFGLVRFLCHMERPYLSFFDSIDLGFWHVLWNVFFGVNDRGCFAFQILYLDQRQKRAQKELLTAVAFPFQVRLFGLLGEGDEIVQSL